MLRKIISGVGCALVLGLALNARAVTNVGWASWTDATPGATNGSVTGTMQFGTTTVNMSYTGELDFAETGSGTDYVTSWPATYTSATVPNGPPAAELVALTGGDTTVDTITYSTPVLNPLMAFVSLGAPGTTVTYHFNEPFTVLSSGTGYWGSTDPVTPLTQLPGNEMSGQESDGVIQFDGNFTSISWTIPGTGEYWDGYTFGAQALSAPGVPIGPTGTTTSTVPVPPAVWTSLLTLGLITLVGKGRKAFKTA